MTIYKLNSGLFANGILQDPGEKPLDFLGRVIAKGGFDSIHTWPHVLRELNVGPVPSTSKPVELIGTLFGIIPLYLMESP